MRSKYAIAGEQFLKGNLGNAITALTFKSGTSELIQPSRYRNGKFFFGVNGADKAFIWGNYNSSLKAYQQCPIIPAIINRKAQCMVNGKQYVLDLDGNESDTLQAKSLRKLLSRPNPYQSGRNFKGIGSIYKQIYGYCPVLKIIPVGYERDFSRWRLFNIPPWILETEDSAQMFFESELQPFKSLRLTYLGNSTPLDPKIVFFLKENQLSTSTFNTSSTSENVSWYLPDSKLLPLTDSIDNLVSSLKSRGSLIRQRGPMWILSNDSNDSAEAGAFPIDPTQKKDLHEDFSQYGILSEQRKALITDAKLKLQQVGFNMAELQLLEGEIQDAKMICDGLNYPPYLLGLVDAKFDNQQIAERNLYTNSIIPDVQSDDEQWSETFGLIDLGLKLETDFSGLPALQENIAEQGRGRSYMNQGLLVEFLNNIITMNRWREILGEDQVDGGDKYYNELLKDGITFGAVPNIAPIPAENPKPSNN